MNHNYFDVYYQPGENPVFCYRTGMAVYEEALIGGAFVAQGYNAAGYPLNVLTNCATRLNPREFAEPFAFNLEVNGACIDYALKLVDFTTEKTEENIHSVIVLESEIAPVIIRVHTLLDGTAMFTRWLEIENLSDAPLNISRMNPMAGGIEILDRPVVTRTDDVEKLYSISYCHDDTWCKEGDYSWQPLRPDTLSIDSRFNRAKHRHPLIFLRNNVTGNMWFCQIAHSGGCRFTVDLDAKPECGVSALSFKAEITGHNPLLILNAKETFTTPEVHMGIVCGDIDMAVNEMHAHARKSVLNVPEADGSACLIGAGMGAEHDMSVETSKIYIDQFKEMGGEIFIIDAGWETPPTPQIDWYNFNGMNVPNPDRYPNGISELSDYCHERGMKFALWVEIERLGKFCPAYNEHPEWRLNNVYGKQSTALFDFTNPEAAKWAEDELARIIEEYKLDLLRIDFNIDAKDYHFFKPHAGGINEYTGVRQFMAANKMYMNLKKRFPNVIFENCAGGGGRTDYAQMKAFNHTWVADWQRNPRSVLITNGMTMALPPERVDRLFAGMGCHEYGSFDAHMRNTMFGHMSLNVVACPTTYANPVQMEFIKHSVKLYKEFIRPFLPTSKIFHHTPDTEECIKQGYCMLELSSQDSDRGIFGVFTLAESKNSEFHFTLKGVDPSKTYKVTLDNLGCSFEKTGADLYMNGLTVKVPASMSSELVIYEAI